MKNCRKCGQPTGDKPLRGYFLPLVGGGHRFVPVRPTRVRAGTGEGIVTDVNEDYFDCSWSRRIVWPPKDTPTTQTTE